MASIMWGEPGPKEYQREPNPPQVPGLNTIGEGGDIYTDERILHRQPIADEEWAEATRSTDWTNYWDGWAEHHGQPNRAPDFFTLGLNWVMSQRAFDIFKSFCCLEYCQIVELDPVIGPEWLDNVDYWYVHVKDRVPAIDVEESDDIELSEAAIKYGGIGYQIKECAPFENPRVAVKKSVIGDRHCWFEKLTLTGHNLFVSDALRNAWLMAGCGTIYFRQCTLVDDREIVAA